MKMKKKNQLFMDHLVVEIYISGYTYLHKHPPCYPLFKATFGYVLSCFFGQWLFSLMKL